MKVAVSFPVQTYDTLLERCPVTCREYAMLKNGVVRHNGGDAGGKVSILCNAEDAQLLFALAARAHANGIEMSERVEPLHVLVDGIGDGKSLDRNAGYWRESFPAEHLVQIYEHDESLGSKLAAFVHAGLQRQEGVIVIATTAHLAGLEARLSLSGLDLDTARVQNRYIALEAEGMLERFMVNGMPHEELFRGAVGELVARARGEGRHVRAFGEMVALLWTRGDEAATIRLENLWQDLCREESFSLLCAYPRAGFIGALPEAVRAICAAHSKVIPV